MRMQTFWIPSILAIICFAKVDMAEAADDGENIAAVVGISLATSLVTTLVTLAVAFVLHKHFTTKKRRQRLSRDHEPSVRSSNNSHTPLTNRQQSYTAVSVLEVPSEDSTLRPPDQTKNKRIKSDFIAKWCTEHKLTEHTAGILRQKGFTYQEAIDTLNTEIIERLNLMPAQECMLRDIVKRNNRPALYPSNNRIRSRSTSSDAIHSPRTPSEPHNSSAGSSGNRFDRHNSLDDMIDGAVATDQVGRPLHLVTRPSMGSMDIITEGPGPSRAQYRPGPPSGGPQSPGQQQPLLQQPLYHSSQGHLAVRQNYKMFKGLLADHGLHDLAQMLGKEWQRLAAILDVPSHKIDQIKADYPSNIRQQIYEMLRYYRDTATGDKEQIKGKLHDALEKVDRSDLARDLLMEQVDGSAERVAYHSII